METTLNSKEFYKYAFSSSSKGKIVCAIESAFLYGAMAIIIGHALAVFTPEKLEYTDLWHIVAIYVTSFAVLMGIIMGYKVPTPLFVWRFFKPTQEDIEKYKQIEIERLQNIIDSNSKYTKELEEQISKIKEKEEKLKIELKNLNSI